MTTPKIRMVHHGYVKIKPSHGDIKELVRDLLDRLQRTCSICGFPIKILLVLILDEQAMRGKGWSRPALWSAHVDKEEPHVEHCFFSGPFHSADERGGTMTSHILCMRRAHPYGNLLSHARRYQSCGKPVGEKK